MREYCIHRTYIFRVTPPVSDGKSLQVYLDSWVVHVLSVDLVTNGRHVLATIRLYNNTKRQNNYRIVNTVDKTQTEL